MKPRQNVRARLMGRTGAWVPHSRDLARELVQRCRTIGQKAAVHVLLALWQDQQSDRAEPSWDVVAGVRTIARDLDVDPKSARRLLEQLLELGVLEETNERGSRGARVVSFTVRGRVDTGQPADHSATVSDRGPLDTRNKTLPGAPGHRTGDTTGGEATPDEDAVRCPSAPPSRISAPPFGRSRAEIQKSARGSVGPGRTQLRLRLFASLEGGKRQRAEAQELLELAEAGSVDDDWQRRADSVLEAGGLKGGEAEQRTLGVVAGG